jgi:hypothetical protein
LEGEEFYMQEEIAKIEQQNNKKNEPLKKVPKRSILKVGKEPKKDYLRN